MLELTAIAPDIYIPFIVGHFLKRNRRIEVADVERVYTLFKGHTFYIQKTFNEAFADTPEGEICTLEMIRAAINNMIAANDTIFREILSNIPEKQKELLYAIAKDGEAERITSGSFIKRHSLTSASSVQSAVKKLLEKDIITEINKVFSLTDKLFSMWINQIYGNKSIFYRRNLVFQKGAQKQRDHTKKSNSYKTYFLSEVGKENMYKYTALRDKCRIFVHIRQG